jgi:hypothetical protein
MHACETRGGEGWGYEAKFRTSFPDVMRLYASTVIIAEMMRQHGINMGASAFGNPEDVTIPRRVAPSMLMPAGRDKDGSRFRI